jgi:hypothetical protein
LKRSAGGKHSRSGARVRLAVDDQRQDPIIAPQPLELDDLLVDPATLRRRRAAQHDQVGRLAERFAQRRRQIGRGRELVAVAEHRKNLSWNRTTSARPAHQRLWHAIAFNTPVQPAGPVFVLVAVAYECQVLAIGRRAARRFHTLSYRASPIEAPSILANSATVTVARQEERNVP